MHLVGNVLSIDRVLLVGVLNHKDPVLLGLEVVAARLFQGGALGHVAIAVGVVLSVAWQGARLLVDEAVAPVAVELGVDAEGENVLVVCAQDTVVHHGSVWHVDAGVNGLGRQNARGTDLVRHFAGLVKDVGQDVLIVGHGDDALNDKLAAPHDDGAAAAVVCVLPQDAGVLLVDAHGVGLDYGAAVVVCHEAILVGNGAKAVAAQLEVVGHDTGADVPQVKGLLLVKGRAGVGVRYRHVAQRHAVKERSAVVRYLVEDHTLAEVEAGAHLPLLPLDGVSLEGEGSALGLDHAQWLEVGPLLVELWNILIGGDRSPWLRRLCL